MPRDPIPDEFDVYTVVVLRRPADAPRMSDGELDALQARHLEYRSLLVQQDMVVVNGPFDERSGPSYLGMSIFARDATEAARLSGADPSVAAGRLAYDVMAWWVRAGSLAFPRAARRSASAVRWKTDVAAWRRRRRCSRFTSAPTSRSKSPDRTFSAGTSSVRQDVQGTRVDRAPSSCASDHITPRRQSMSYVPSRSIEGSVAVITGASAGIGAATARALVAAGANVAVAARRQERLDALSEELGPDRVVGVTGDVRDPRHNEALVDAAAQRWGRVDTVIANAGIGAYGGILDLEDGVLQEMVETNYLGTVWTVRAGVRHMRAHGNGGDIVIISSVAGFRGGADEAVYAGTKHAQVGLGGSLDRELRGEGIRVTLVCPAGTSTEFAIGAGRDEDSPELDAYLRPEDVAHAVQVVLEQPRSVRTTVWQLWSTEQQS